MAYHMYYHRDGTPATQEESMELFGKSRVVKQETTPSGFFVSTVFLVLNHAFGEGPPLIFETMVFSDDSGRDLDCERYSTEEEARAGHEKWVKKYTCPLN